MFLSFHANRYFTSGRTLEQAARSQEDVPMSGPLDHS
jgi:hypothetical protein